MIHEQTAPAETYVATNLINLPDLHFVRWCEQQFSINRGVYNTIDERLYEHGYYVITERRLQLITFLQSISQSDSPLKFGHGNLSKALQQFFAYTRRNLQ
jgi:riboflavin kinase